MDFMGFFKNFGIYQRYLGYFQRFLEFFRDFWDIFKNFCDFYGFFRIFQGFLGHFQGFLIFSPIIVKKRKSPEFCNSCGISSTFVMNSFISQASRQSEAELRSQLALLASGERSVRSELSQVQQDNDSLQAK